MDEPILWKIYEYCEVEVKWDSFSITTLYDLNASTSNSLSQNTQQMALKNEFNSSPESIKLLKH
jgi:hypothetical protein